MIANNIQMISEIQINEAVTRLFSNISFEQEPSGLYDPLRYMISIGGKRIRPKLCLTSYALFKDCITDEVLEPAAALEVFHTFTLIHDDIMDKSPLRRGMPTVWTKWNEDTAILSGDVMLIDSYKRIAKVPSQVHAAALDLFSTTAAQVCEGQQLDMDFENVPLVSMSEYNRMIGLKTAVLLACSAKMGALIAGAAPEDCEALYRYGYELGMAFQVADDYLDAYGDQAVFGKPIGGDIVNNKKSWLLTKAFELTSDREDLFCRMAMPVENDVQRNAKIQAVKEVYENLGVNQAAKDEIIRFNQRAIEAVSSVKFNPECIASLKSFADKLIGRAK